MSFAIPVGQCVITHQNSSGNRARKTVMKIHHTTALWLAAGLFAATVAHSQSAPPPGPPPGAPPAGAPASQALTAAELAKVKAVLAPYKSASLSVDDAKAIKRALRDAGLRRSRELDEALRKAGFSAEKMDALDPPPPRPRGDAPPPPRK